MPVPDVDVEELQGLMRSERMRKQSAIFDFRCAVENGDLEAFAAAADELGLIGGWAKAFQAIAALDAEEDFRNACMRWWEAVGDSLRSQACNDLAIARGLRAILPRYSGPAITLYRGEAWWNRRNRTYGLSWTSRRAVAEDFAMRQRPLYRDGSVLLEAHCGPDAIICAPALGENRYAEAEYIVDRTKLISVSVLDRYR